MKYEDIFMKSAVELSGLGIITTTGTGHTWHWNGAWSREFATKEACRRSLLDYAHGIEGLFRRPPEWDEEEKRPQAPSVPDGRIVFRDFHGDRKCMHSVSPDCQHVRLSYGHLYVNGFAVHPDDAARVAAAFGLPWPAEGGGE